MREICSIILPIYNEKDNIPIILNKLLNCQKKIIKPHLHKNFTRVIKKTNEVLIILKGILKVNFYNENKKLFKSLKVKKKQILILVDGGHGFEVIKPVEMIEVKQGPYKKYKDKKLI